MLRFSLIASFFILFGANAQETLVLKIVVEDNKTGDRINNAKVHLESVENNTFKTTQSSGEVFFECNSPLKGKLTVEHAVYSTFSKKIVSKDDSDTIEIKVFLDPLKTQFVGEMIAKPVGKPYTVYSSHKVSVSDYEILADDKLVLLTYPKRLKKGSAIELVEGQKTLHQYEIPDVATELVRDFRGNAHLVCSTDVLGIIPQKNDLLIARSDKAYFLKYVAPIIDSNSTKLYFSNFNELYPAFEYYTYDQLDSAYSKIIAIEDELMMELYRSEFKWVDVRTKIWAKEKENETGIDAEIWVGANYFTKSLYYEPLYAPLFHRNDSVFVFDYYKDLLFTYDYKGDLIDSVSIYHHYQPKKSGWKKELIQDDQTGQIYALFERGGLSYLGFVNTNTGEINERIQLEFKYAEEVKVHNNFVYYIYRPFESTQKKYLYKEKLPYSFPLRRNSLAGS